MTVAHLESHTDNRGKFVELVREEDGAYQIAFSTSKPGVTRGDHWHSRKEETFFVVSGEATIRLRPVGSKEITAVKVDGLHATAVAIPPRTVHNITNTGTEDMCLVIWCSEPYSEDDPDTNGERVEIEGSDDCRDAPGTHTVVEDYT